MRRFPSWPRPVLLPIAAVFAAATALYSALWMHYVQVLPVTNIGIVYHAYSEGEAALRVSRIRPDSAAQAAGLRRGDRITAVNGRPLKSFWPFLDDMQPVRGSARGIAASASVRQPDAVRIDRFGALLHVVFRRLSGFLAPAALRQLRAQSAGAVAPPARWSAWRRQPPCWKRSRPGNARSAK